MKEGAVFGAVMALFLYMFLPIYGSNGIEASILPTGNVVADQEAAKGFISNLPFSTIIFISLELMGISLGIVAQRLFSEYYTHKN